MRIRDASTGMGFGDIKEMQLTITGSGTLADLRMMDGSCDRAEVVKALPSQIARPMPGTQLVCPEVVREMDHSMRGEKLFVALKTYAVTATGQLEYLQHADVGYNQVIDLFEFSNTTDPDSVWGRYFEKAGADLGKVMMERLRSAAEPVTNRKGQRSPIVRLGGTVERPRNAPPPSGVPYPGVPYPATTPPATVNARCTPKPKCVECGGSGKYNCPLKGEQPCSQGCKP